jgi:mTERF
MVTSSSLSEFPDLPPPPREQARCPVEPAQGINMVFVTELGMSPLQLELMQKKHSMLQLEQVPLGMRDRVEGLVTFLKEGMGLSTNQIVTMLLYSTALLAFSGEEVAARALWLRDSVGIPEDELRTLVVKLPSLLYLSVEHNLQPKLLWLKEALQLTDKELAAILAKYPCVLSFSLEANLQPKIAYLISGLGLTVEAVKSMVMQLPQLLGYSLEGNLQPKMDWLRKTVGLRKQHVRAVVSAAPLVLASNAVSLDARYHFLRRDLGLSPADVVGMLQKVPALLTFRLVNSMQPKMAFYRQEVGLSKEELAGLLAKHPWMLTQRVDSLLRPKVSSLSFSCCTAQLAVAVTVAEAVLVVVKCH